MIENHRVASDCDILIIAEGTYPFQRGGVASWISDLIHNMPQLRFGIIFLGSYHGLYQDYAYPVPSNVIHLQVIYMFEYKEKPLNAKKVSPGAVDRLTQFHDNLSQSFNYYPGLKEPLIDIDDLMQSKQGFDETQFMRSKESWEFIVKKYQNFSYEPFFLNYFWNIRNMHEPLWNLRTGVDNAPLCKIIHPISTGYAGLLSVLIKQKQNKPILLSEHGLYTRERNIELLQSSMIIEDDPLLSETKIFSYQHSLWLRFFASLARMTYNEAVYIISLYKGAQAQQIASGADAVKTRVIPNGVDVDRFKQLRHEIGPENKHTVSFVGRFVRIKDIKTFIRSIYLIKQKYPKIKALIKMVGQPDDNYLQECMEYIDYLGLSKEINFLEEGGMAETLLQTRILILSSISEGMPLVILEALSAGVPVISTDVGSCRELIEGIGEEDKALGKAGAVVSIANSVVLADEAIRFLENDSLWKKAQQAGIARMEKYYTLGLMISRYQKLYDEIMKWPA